MALALFTCTLEAQLIGRLLWYVGMEMLPNTRNHKDQEPNTCLGMASILPATLHPEKHWLSVVVQCYTPQACMFTDKEIKDLEYFWEQFSFFFLIVILLI